MMHGQKNVKLCVVNCLMLDTQDPYFIWHVFCHLSILLRRSCR